MRITVFAIVFSLLAACAPASNPTPRAGALDDGAGPIMLVTHPTPRVMRRMQTLLDEGLIAIPGVRVVGVAHASEIRDYGPTEEYVDRMPRLGFHRVDCPLDDETLFQSNDCTDAFDKLIARSVGIVFTGGPDIPPSLYGEPTLLTTVIETPNRIGWELSLLYHLVGRGDDDGKVPFIARRPKYPVLAICMGMQALNVATGGTLHQDIPSEIYGKKTYDEVLAQPPEEIHRSVHAQLNPVPGIAWASFHAVRLVDGSSLAGLGGGTPSVLSAHHQAAEKIGTGLRVIATSMDGKVVEAVEHEKFENVLGVQFHPDYLVLWKPAESFAEHIGDEISNIASERMGHDQLSRAFNRGIWELFSRRASE
jgi:putative glutamine amidotransferase